jgi:glycosyltransferase involved in cell wall biosynthesis
MTVPGALPHEVADDAVFIAWGPPAYTNRTRPLAAALGIEVRHVYSTRRRGALAAVVKYPYQAVATTWYLLRRRPSLVFAQHPPSFTAMVAAAYGAITGSPYVVDAHSDAFDSPWWSRPRWLQRVVARRALTTIVTNDHFADLLRAGGAHASIVRDFPTELEPASYPMAPGLNVVVIATFAPDEPLAEVVSAARALPDVTFRVTGDTRREGAAIPSDLPPNVELTGFLPAADYYGLVHGSDAAMALTTRDHTMQRGACEALSLGTPIITSDWPLLRTYFCKGTVHVDNTAAGIRDGIDRLRGDLDRYRKEIVELRTDVGAEWDTAREALVERILTCPAIVHRYGSPSRTS